MTTTNRLRTGLQAAILGCTMLASVAAAQPADPANDAKARGMLKAMSDYIGGLGAIEATVDTSLEVVTPEMEKIAFTATSVMKMTRPNQVLLKRVGGFANVEFIFDGATLTLRDRNNNQYAQLPLQGTTDELVTGLHDQLGMAVPGADILLRDSYSVLIEDVIEAKFIGQGVVAGQMCDHITFRNFETDWQLWIRTGADKIPCKMIITSKTVGMAPQYTTHVRNWVSNPKFAPGTFAFKPASGEQKIDVNALEGIDEVPPSSTKGNQK